MQKIFIITCIISLFFSSIEANTITKINTNYIRTIETLQHENKKEKYFKEILNFYNLETDYTTIHFIEFISTVLSYYELNEFINLETFTSLIYTESRFNQDAISKKGAVGLCQIMPLTEKIVNNGLCNTNIILKRDNAYDNIIISVLYLKDLQKRLGDDLEKVLRFYNGGTDWKNIKHTKTYYNIIIKRAEKLSMHLSSQGYLEAQNNL